MDIYNQILDENELKYHKINDEVFKEVLTEFFEKVDSSYELRSDMDYTDKFLVLLNEYINLSSPDDFVTKLIDITDNISDPLEKSYQLKIDVLLLNTYVSFSISNLQYIWHFFSFSVFIIMFHCF